MPEIRNLNNVAEKLLAYLSLTGRQTCPSYKWNYEVKLASKTSLRWNSRLQKTRVWLEYQIKRTKRVVKR